MKIQNSTILITGAASGLGAAVASHFYSIGATIILADMNEEAGNAYAAELGERAHFITTDVTSEESVKSALELATAQEYPLSVTVNCAGILAAGKTVGKKGAFPLDTFAKVIQVNLIGTFNVTRLAAEQMATNTPNDDGERGVVINTASIAAFEGQMGQTAYSASKAGVAGLTLPLARDLASLGIRVNTIAPGIFDTAMMAGVPEHVREALAANIPFPSKLGDPADFAELAEHIVSNKTLNGETIRLDGALRMSAR